MSLNPRTSHAIKWSLLGEAATRLAMPLVLLVLARLLVPADFGVVAAATVLVSFSQTLAEAGLGRAIVQRPDRVDDACTVAFWINLGLALAVMVVLLATAPWIAAFFHDPRIADVVRVLALQVPLAALCTVQVARLQRNLDFKELSLIRLATAVLPALVSIPMAIAGHGYWALVAGALLGQLSQALVLWWRSPWRPTWSFPRPLARELARFGFWATMSAMLAWFYLWMDAVVVGRFLGAGDMGLYRTANTLVTMLFGLAFAPLLPVFYSVISRSGHDRDRVGRALMDFSDAMTMLALPMAAVIALAGPWVEGTLFGPAWTGMGLVVALLAAGQGLAWMVGANGEAYRAIGRPRLETIAMALSSAVYLAGYLVSVQHGLMAFVVTRVLLVGLGIAIQVVVSCRTFGMPAREWLAIVVLPAASSTLAYLVAIAAPLPPAADTTTALARLAVFAAVFAALIATLGKTRLGRIRRLLHAA